MAVVRFDSPSLGFLSRRMLALGSPRPSVAHIAEWVVAGCCGVRHASVVLASSLWLVMEVQMGVVGGKLGR